MVTTDTNINKHSVYNTTAEYDKTTHLTSFTLSLCTLKMGFLETLFLNKDLSSLSERFLSLAPLALNSAKTYKNANNITELTFNALVSNYKFSFCVTLHF